MKQKYTSSRVQLNRFLCFLFLFLVVFKSTYAQEKIRPWKGFAILGNGSLCAVYSDDPRTKGKGIQHLYYGNYTCNYVRSTCGNLFRTQIKTSLKPIKKDSVGMCNFFTTSTLSYFENDIVREVNCYAHPDGAIILSTGINGSSTDIIQNTEIVLTGRIMTDRPIILKSVKILNGKAIAEWTNHTFLVIGCKDPFQKISITDSVVSVVGKANHKVDILVTMGQTAEGALHIMNKLVLDKDFLSTSRAYWETWIKKGFVPQFPSDDEKHYSEYYKRNLYCAKAVSLGGIIPADITGYFATNNMPQLYPRDAMMCARVFLLTGHIEEARDVITFWANEKISMRNKGEWYARYDAYSNAVDAGSGARFDEPEWDANGYFIQLLNMYHQKTNIWLTNADFIYQLADFLVSKIDHTGLLYEGGIIEWTGYLPATNMTCAAALQTASKIALDFGDHKRASVYKIASEKIACSLPIMFDKQNKTYADVRFIGKKGNNNESLAENKGDTLYLWNTTMNFGVLWGFPNHKEVALSNEYYQKSTVKKNGGVQYFTAPDQWLAGYGNCMFFFSTAACAQYQSLYGDPIIAKEHIDWMIRNVNSYGLMPERITVDDSDPTPASPLSWCCAEFSAAVLFYGSRK